MKHTGRIPGIRCTDKLWTQSSEQSFPRRRAVTSFQCFFLEYCAVCSGHFMSPFRFRYDCPASDCCILFPSSFRSFHTLHPHTKSTDLTMADFKDDDRSCPSSSTTRPASYSRHRPVSNSHSSNPDDNQSSKPEATSSTLYASSSSYPPVSSTSNSSKLLDDQHAMPGTWVEDDSPRPTRRLLRPGLQSSHLSSLPHRSALTPIPQTRTYMSKTRTPLPMSGTSPLNACNTSHIK